MRRDAGARHAAGGPHVDLSGGARREEPAGPVDEAVDARDVPVRRETALVALPPEEGRTRRGWKLRDERLAASRLRLVRDWGERKRASDLSSAHLLKCARWTMVSSGRQGIVTRRIRLWRTRSRVRMFPHRTCARREHRARASARVHA